jgi:hypothetical protein
MVALRSLCALASGTSEKFLDRLRILGGKVKVLLFAISRSTEVSQVGVGSNAVSRRRDGRSARPSKPTVELVEGEADDDGKDSM